MNDKEKMPPNATTSGEKDTGTHPVNKKSYEHIKISEEVKGGDANFKGDVGSVGSEYNVNNEDDENSVDIKTLVDPLRTKFLVDPLRTFDTNIPSGETIEKSVENNDVFEKNIDCDNKAPSFSDLDKLSVFEREREVLKTEEGERNDEDDSKFLVSLLRTFDSDYEKGESLVSSTKYLPTKSNNNKPSQVLITTTKNLKAATTFFSEIEAILKDKNERKACILYFCYKNKLVYLSLFNKLYPKDNPNTIRSELISLTNKGVLINLPNNGAIEHQRRIIERAILNSGSASNYHIDKINYYSLTEPGLNMVKYLKRELLEIIPEDKREKIEKLDVLLYHTHKQFEFVDQQLKMETKKQETEREEKRKASLKAEREEKLLTLCLPFKAEIMALDRIVVLDRSKDGSIYSEELKTFVNELQKKERLISPFGVRAIWQRWRDER